MGRKMCYTKDTMETQITHYYGNKHDLGDVFISAFKEIGLITIACKKAGITRSTFNRWKNDETEWGDVFSQKYYEAVGEVCERLGDKLRQMPKQKLSFEMSQMLNN